MISRVAFRLFVDNSFEFTEQSFSGILILMEKFVTLQKVRRKRKHGFLQKMSTHGGTKVIKRRMTKKRKRLTV